MLITGCGRSGTTYITHIFQKSGYDVTHENEGGSFGTASFKHLFPKDRSRGYKVILHQVRHPLATMSTYHGAENRNFIRERIMQMKNKILLWWKKLNIGSIGI